MKTKVIIAFLLLTFNYSVVYCIDLNIVAGRAQSHQKNVDSYKNTFTFSLGADYYKKKNIFLRTNMTYQLYKFEKEQVYDSKYLALNSLICFSFLNDKKSMLFFGSGFQSSFLLPSDAKNTNEDIKKHPFNLGVYAQMGGYLKCGKFYIGFIVDACYYFGGVGKIESEKLPGVCSAQYLSLIIPLNYEK